MFAILRRWIGQTENSSQMRNISQGKNSSQGKNEHHRDNESQGKNGLPGNNSFQWKKHLSEIEKYVSENRVRIQHKQEPTGIQYSVRDNDIEDYIASQQINMTFADKLFWYLEQNKTRSVDFYHAAGFDRKLFSAIKTNRQSYRPSKNTAVRCCLALHLPVEEFQKMLSLAGYTLGRSRKDDLIIRYCIEHSIWNVMDVNEILIAFGEKGLMP